MTGALLEEAAQTFALHAGIALGTCGFGLAIFAGACRIIRHREQKLVRRLGRTVRPRIKIEVSA